MAGDLTPTEREFQGQVLTLAQRGGWMHFHDHDSRKSTPGFPDLVLVRKSTGQLVLAELKTNGGKVRPEQRDWLDALCAVESAAITRGFMHLYVYLWRPVDMPEITTLLMSRPEGWAR